MFDLPVVENIFAMLGTLFCSFQLVPQAHKNWQCKSTEGLSSNMLLLWAFSSTLFGIYTIIESLSIPLILQPQLFCIIALFCNVQCLYYDQHVYPFDNGSMERKFKYGVVFVVRLLVLGAIQAAGVIGVKIAEEKEITWPKTTLGIIPTAILLCGFIPQFYEIYHAKMVQGISLIFMALDISGAAFSILSL
ncbi:8045_t:CDS:2, partial [Paraglomus brasilianum]